MVTLHHPFDADSLHFLAVKILNGKYPPPDKRYTKHLCDLIRNMLSRDPKGRPTLVESIQNPALATAIHEVRGKLIRRGC
jgi:NIMA (never in mitosis gene a)-related kinase 1/4/5